MALNIAACATALIKFTIKSFTPLTNALNTFCPDSNALNTPSMIGVIELLKISKVAFTLSVILLLFSNSVLYVLNCSVAPSKLGNNAVAYA